MRFVNFPATSFVLPANQAPEYIQIWYTSQALDAISCRFAQSTLITGQRPDLSQRDAGLSAEEEPRSFIQAATEFHRGSAALAST